MADDLDELRSRIRIVDLVGQVVRLKKSGRNWSGLCPFHDDKNPSFTVSDETGRYRCWSCGEKGDIFTWVMKTQHVEFGEALRILAASIGYTLSSGKAEDRGARERQKSANVSALEFFVSQLAKNGEAKAYLDRRGIDSDLCAKWELGYAPAVDGALATYLSKNGIPLPEAKELFLVDQDPNGGYFDKFRGRVMFPIRDERGQLVAFGGRILGDGIPKYINSSDTPLFRKSRTLYGLNIAKQFLKGDAPLVLAEGYLDVIACHRAGVETAVASLGTSLTEEHAKLISRWTSKVVILYDADAAGEKAALRAFDLLRKEGLSVRVALMPEGEDPDTLLRSQGAAAVQNAVASGLPPAMFQFEMLLRRSQPTEEAFWRDATDILSAHASELEAAELMQRLAAMHPNLRDPKEAYAAIRRMVVQKRRVESGQTRRRGPVADATPKLGIKSAEVALFRGLLDETLRSLVWSAFSEGDLFLTSKAERLGAAIARAFPAAPQGPPTAWLHQVGEDEDQSLLAEISMRYADPLTPEFLAEAVASLKKRREERVLQKIKTEPTGDERLRAIQEKLTELQGH